MRRPDPHLTGLVPAVERIHCDRVAALSQAKGRFIAILGLFLTACPASGGSLEEQLTALSAQNERLIEMVQQQQAQIDALRDRLEKNESEAAAQEAEIQRLWSESQPVAGPVRRNGWGNVIVSGETGLAFFSGEANTEFPNEEFRVDDARLFVEAEIASGVYFASSLELYRRETYNSDPQIGHLYVDFEDAFRDALPDGLLNLRVGRFDTPFGEEYQQRYVMENPLISHSVSDLWGIDEGIGLWGRSGSIDYAVAAQNGGPSALRDFDSDKSLAGRLGMQASERLRLSGSLMRTGDLDAQGDGRSEFWIGNVVFVPIGSPATTTFSANLAQLDANWNMQDLHLAASFGYAEYQDNDPLADNSRDFSFFHLEAKRYLSARAYAALRYSGLEADGGYPLSGNGARRLYFRGGPFTEQLERLSIGLGYWPSENIVMKLEYSLEDGKHVDGSQREDSDQLAAEVGARF